MFFLRFTFRFVGLIVSVFLVLPIVLLIISFSLKTKKTRLHKNIIIIWSTLICYTCGIKIKLKGQPKSGPVLIVANHVSWLDIAVIHRFKLVGFVAKSEIANWPLLGTVARCGESIFISRGKVESRSLVLRAMNKRLKLGKSIAIFPEGGAKNGDKLGRFHRQLMQSAVETKLPIQAVAIKYMKNNGIRNKKIGFTEKENLISNILRIISLPTSTVEAIFCDPIETTNKTARDLALITHGQVTKILSKNDYI